MHHSPSVDSGFPGSSFTSQDMTFVHEHLKTVCIPHETSLGLCVAGGTDQNEGPNVFIQDIFPGGDVHSVSLITYFSHGIITFDISLFLTPSAPTPSAPTMLLSNRRL